MVCESCGKNEANVFFKAVVDNKTTKINLCENCAKEKGILGDAANAPDFEKQSFGLSDIVSSLLSELDTDIAKSLKTSTRPSQLKCPNCSTTFASFKTSGFLGCSQCYEAFRPAMKDIVKRIHGTSTHTGITYEPAKPVAAKESAARPKPPKAPSPRNEIARLKKELDVAVKTEAYEEAAILRDKIKELEKRI